jgi:hypothetical protein
MSTYLAFQLIGDKPDWIGIWKCWGKPEDPEKNPGVVSL